MNVKPHTEQHGMYFPYSQIGEAIASKASSTLFYDIWSPVATNAQNASDTLLINVMKTITEEMHRALTSP